MKKTLKLCLLLIISLQMTSCITKYYSYYLLEDTPLFEDNRNKDSKTIIPKDSQIYISNKSGTSSYVNVKWKNHKGKLYQPKILTPKEFITYSNKNVTSKKESPSTNLYSNDSTSAKHISTTHSKSSTGSVYVKGYYRKNGTYVRPHTRKAPTRRK